MYTFKEAVILKFVQHFANDQNGPYLPSKYKYELGIDPQSLGSGDGEIKKLSDQG